MLVDSHCHLDYFVEAEIEAVLARARDAGIGRMVTIGTRVGQAAAVKALTERFPDVWGTVGVHPHNAGEPEGLPSVEALAALADHPRIIGLGESGLDYFYDKAPREAQQEGFRRHIRAARITGLPLAIHARQADDDIIGILREEHAAAGGFPFLLHCFSSGPELARQAVALGGYVSFSGILTFPKSTELRALAAELPAERLLVETDSPYLAPVPLRGKRCEPAYVAHTARVLAEARGIGIAEVEVLTTANFFRLYPKAA
ncbi:LuxR family transcriptional regulator [Siccirubricoccus deserti]|uniref:TatD family hydrolase n=1 Tax=Siccirubricoccus deserti TaxID=2013562 RepID=A0A9X0R3W8_9PROT|nr:TatD family hydrolase [Siccirubricoccus deserti]MBC4017837.1 TatD family hydrolase [Siccirubricoccus deserti]GGC53184.1 LuxR family transcriptional regulator [Siccirubricoccus deserti]